MAKAKRLIKSIFMLFLPIALLLVVAVAGSAVWLVHETSQPLRAAYLVTPDKYGQLSARGAKVTDEKWQNADGTSARGWLLRGTMGAPAVVLLHKYGADRSYELNLGVKINEATNFTVLMPDQRGHGQDPTVSYTSFGGCESDDAVASLGFLRGLKTPEQLPQVGPNVGVYGIEMGALAALFAASKDQDVKAIVLDSVPQSSDTMLASAVDKRFPFASSVTAKVAQLGSRPYFYEGCYKPETSGDLAKTISGRQVLLLAGIDAPDFRESTAKLSKLFPPTTQVDAKTDLSPSGYGIMKASIELSGSYDQRVIDFFRAALAN